MWSAAAPVPTDCSSPAAGCATRRGWQRARREPGATSPPPTTTTSRRRADGAREHVHVRRALEGRARTRLMPDRAVRTFLEMRERAALHGSRLSDPALRIEP